MAFLAILLKDPGHCLAVRGRIRGGLELGYRAADGCDVSRLHLVALEQGRDRVLELVARRIGVANPTLRELIVDSTVVAHMPLGVDDEGLGRHRCADLRANAPWRSRTTGNFRLKSRAWAFRSASLRSGSTQTPTHFTGFAGKAAIREPSVGL